MANALARTATGVGLKPRHFAQVLEGGPAPGFVEVHAENYMVAGGRFLQALEAIRERLPVTLHGVALSLGGEAPPDRAHLDRLRELVRRFRPAVFSEHLAWSGHGGVFLNDLLPLAYDAPTLRRVCEHIDQTQHHLGCRLLLENPSTYLQLEAATMSEAQFLAEIVRGTGCGLLLDINNVHVSAVNHGADPAAFLDELPLRAVGQVHLAGFTRDTDAAGAPLLVDSHAGPVDAGVWALYESLLERTGPVPTLVEWDQDIPPFDRLLQEAAHAGALMAAVAARGCRLEATA